MSRTRIIVLGGLVVLHLAVLYLSWFYSPPLGPPPEWGEATFGNVFSPVRLSAPGAHVLAGLGPAVQFPTRQFSRLAYESGPVPWERRIGWRGLCHSLLFPCEVRLHGALTQETVQGAMRADAGVFTAWNASLVYATAVLFVLVLRRLHRRNKREARRKPKPIESNADLRSRPGP
jgi:hypothetical protein